MIEPLKLNSNLTFRANEQAKETPKKNKVFNGVIDAIKGFNNVTNTTQGVVRGVVEGSIATAAVGIIGKNVKKSGGKIAGTLGGSLKDTFKLLGKAVKSIPSLLTKAPLENIQKLSSLPKDFYKKYLKGNKIAGFVATIAGVGILALRTIQGKFKANSKNADIDHNVNPNPHNN